MSIEAALAAILAAAPAVRAEACALDHAPGRVLAEPVVARIDQPPFNSSAMDGWAIRRADGAAPRRVIGESAAGRRFHGTLGPGEAVRIFTGAPAPDGADAVALQEDATVSGDTVLATAPGPSNIRPRAGDFAAGSCVVEAGRILSPPLVSLCAAAGLGSVRVAMRPRVAILAMGDELLAPGQSPRPDGVYESVSWGISAFVRVWGGLSHRLKAVGDNPLDLVAAVEQASANHDIIVLIGGASVGDHDHARAAVGSRRMKVTSVAMRPGKPTWCAAGEGLPPLLGLPGNPASALVAAAVFLRPLIEASIGLAPSDRVAPVCARLGHDLPANGPRAHLRRARMTRDATGQASVEAAFDQDSSLLSPFAQANVLLTQAAGCPGLARGAIVSCLPLAAV